MSNAQKQLDTRMGNYIPPEIYVGRTSRGADELVGWMIPKLQDEKWLEERKAKIRSWAGEKFPDLEFDNNFTGNFAMIKQVGRFETDKVYWRVLHPRGFEFEISLENFEYLLERYTLDQGLICKLDDSVISGLTLKEAELCLVHNVRNRKWFLVDKDHPEYKRSVNNIIPHSDEHKRLISEAKVDEKAARKAIQPGDTFMHGNKTATFLGTVSVAVGDHADPRVAPTTFKRMKVFRTTGQSYHSRGSTQTNYYFMNQLQVHTIKQQNPSSMTTQSAIDEINHALSNDKCKPFGNEMYFELPRDHAMPIAVWEKKPKQIERVETVVDLPSIIGDFIPELILNREHFAMPKHLRIQVDDDWHNHYEQVQPNVLIRDKTTGKMFVPKQFSRRGMYGTGNHAGFEYGIYRLKFDGRDADLATYYDAEATINQSQNARFERHRYEKQMKDEPHKADFYQRMLDSHNSHIAEKVKSAQAEGGDKEWHYNPNFELVHITYK